MWYLFWNFCTNGPVLTLSILNDAEDYLCLKEEYDCPINSIILKLENKAPDSDYKSLGKYVFNELSAQESRDPQYVDSKENN